MKFDNFSFESNQCGIETFNLERDDRLHIGFESNQCGIETSVVWCCIVIITPLNRTNVELKLQLTGPRGELLGL